MKRMLCLLMLIVLCCAAALAEPASAVRGDAEAPDARTTQWEDIREQLAAERPVRAGAVAALEASFARTLDCLMTAARAILDEAVAEAERLAGVCGEMVARMGRWQHLAR